MKHANIMLQSQQFCELTRKLSLYFWHKYEMRDDPFEEFMNKQKGCINDLAGFFNLCERNFGGVVKRFVRVVTLKFELF